MKFREILAADGRPALDIMRTLLLFLLSSAELDGSFSQKFIYVNFSKTWNQAQTYCRDKYTDLATITDMTDQTNALSFVSFQKLWIGLYKATVTSPWIWSDQSNITFSGWANGQPDNQLGDQYCVSIFIGGWHDLACATPLPFICYTAPPTAPPTSAPPTTAAPPTVKKRQMLRVEVKSDEDANDPEVKKKVLEKIQHILNMKGSGGNVTLSWRIQSDGNVFQKKQQNKDTQLTCP